MMIEVALSKRGWKHKGKYVMFLSDEDADIAEFNWSAYYKPSTSCTVYAYRRHNQTTVQVHRILMGRKLGRELLPNEQVDHIDTNGLNNQRENLRLATPSNNQHNKNISKNNSSGYKGVNWHKSAQKWRATIQVNGIQRHISYHDTPEEAYEAYCEAADKYHKQFKNYG